MLKRFLLYGFPLYLILIEQGIRFLLHENLPSNAPGIAAAGLALLCTLMVRKPPVGISTKESEELKNVGLIISSDRDQKLIEVTTILVFVFAAAWGYCLYLTSQSEVRLLYGFPEQWEISFLIYFVSVFLTEIKEAI